MVILKRIFGGKFSVWIKNPENICYSSSKLESELPDCKMDNLTYQEALDLQYAIKVRVTDKMGLKVVIK